jgi:hypothetical protein
MRKQLKVIRTKEEALDDLKRCRRTNARRKAKYVDKKLSKMASDSKNLVTQKESLVHLQEEIRKMDAGVMFEETSLISHQQKKDVALSNVVRKARSGVSPNLDCGRIWKTSHLRDLNS